MSQPSIVVVGSTGFIGRHLVDSFRMESCRIIEIGRDAFEPNNPNAMHSLRELFMSYKPTCIINLAGLSRSPVFELLYKVNVLITAQIIEAIYASSIDPILVTIGSAAEYGTPSCPDIAISESANCHPNDYYGASKLAQTQMVSVAARMGLRIVNIRPFNVIGVGMPAHLALGNFFAKLTTGLRSGNPVIQVGPLEAERDFVFVEDVVHCIRSLLTTKDAIGRTVNVCTGRCLSIQSLFDMVIGVLDFDIKLQSQNDLVSRGVSRVYGDPALLYSLIHWVPEPVSVQRIRQIVADTGLPTR